MQKESQHIQNREQSPVLCELSKTGQSFLGLINLWVYGRGVLRIKNTGLYSVLSNISTLSRSTLFMAKGRSVPFCTKSTFRPSTSVIPFIIEQYLNRPTASSSLKSTRMSTSLSSRSSPLENDPNSYALSTGCVARYCCIFGMMSVCVLMFIISSLFVYAAKISIFRETAKGFTDF